MQGQERKQVEDRTCKTNVKTFGDCGFTLHYLVKYQDSKNCCTQGLSKSNCHVRISYSKSLMKYTCLLYTSDAADE